MLQQRSLDHRLLHDRAALPLGRPVRAEPSLVNIAAVGLVALFAHACQPGAVPFLQLCLL